MIMGKVGIFVAQLWRQALRLAAELNIYTEDIT